MRGRRRRRGAQRRSGVRGLRRRGRPPSRAPTLSAYPLRAPAVVAMAALGRGRPPPLPPQSAAPPCSSHRPRDAPAILCAHGALAMSRVSQSSAAVKQRSWRAAPGSPARRSPLRAARRAPRGGSARWRYPRRCTQRPSAHQRAHSRARARCERRARTCAASSARAGGGAQLSVCHPHPAPSAARRRSARRFCCRSRRFAHGSREATRPWPSAGCASAQSAALAQRRRRGARRGRGGWRARGRLAAVEVVVWRESLEI